MGKASKRSKTIQQLIQLFGNRCHYCQENCNNVQNHPRMATKEHVVPRCMGGRDILGNYILACSECNNKRGTALFFCTCTWCATVIGGALNDTKALDKILGGIINASKLKVKRNSEGWYVREGNAHWEFDTFEGAVAFADKYSKTWTDEGRDQDVR